MADPLDWRSGHQMPAFRAGVFIVSICSNLNDIPSFVLLFRIQETERHGIQSHEVGIRLDSSRADGLDVFLTYRWVSLAIH